MKRKRRSETRESSEEEVEAKEGGGEEGVRVFLTQFSDRDHHDVFF